MNNEIAGILPVNKSKGKTSFQLVRILRKLLNVKKIGHAGTLDPFATGVMIMMIGKKFTKLSDTFLNSEKEYVTKVHLGIETDTYDCDGKVLFKKEKVPSSAIPTGNKLKPPTKSVKAFSPLQVRGERQLPRHAAVGSESSAGIAVPSLEEIEKAIGNFQGEFWQVPPMFSAKKINGQKLYDLARRGEEIDRPPKLCKATTTILNYKYPFLTLRVICSKGTYIRSIAHDLGEILNCGAHLSALERVRSGNFELKDCISDTKLNEDNIEEIISWISSRT